MWVNPMLSVWLYSTIGFLVIEAVALLWFYRGSSYTDTE